MSTSVAEVAQTRAMQELARSRRAQERAHQHDGIRRDYVMRQARGAENGAKMLLSLARIAS